MLELEFAGYRFGCRCLFIAGHPGQRTTIRPDPSLVRRHGAPSPLCFTTRSCRRRSLPTGNPQALVRNRGAPRANRADAENMRDTDGPSPHTPAAAGPCECDGGTSRTSVSGLLTAGLQRLLDERGETLTEFRQRFLDERAAMQAPIDSGDLERRGVLTHTAGGLVSRAAAGGAAGTRLEAGAGGSEYPPGRSRRADAAVRMTMRARAEAGGKRHSEFGFARELPATRRNSLAAGGWAGCKEPDTSCRKVDRRHYCCVVEISVTVWR